MVRARKVLQKEGEAPPSAFESHRDYLLHLYRWRKQSLEAYSYARFAADLGLPTASVVHQLTSGRRKLTTKAAQKIAQVIGLKGAERQFFLKLVDHANANSPQSRENIHRELVDLKARMAPTPLAADQLAFVSEWYHPVIRELVTLPGVQADPETLARLLVSKVRPEQVRRSLELQVRLGLLVPVPQTGGYHQSEANLSILDGCREMTLALYQKAMADLGADSIASIDPEDRHVTAVSLRVHAGQIPELKKRIHEFNLELLASEAPAGEGDEVYQFNVQFFPLTKVRVKAGGNNNAA